MKEKKRHAYGCSYACSGGENKHTKKEKKNTEHACDCNRTCVSWLKMLPWGSKRGCVGSMGAENGYRGGAVVENGAVGSKRGCRGFMGAEIGYEGSAVAEKGAVGSEKGCKGSMGTKISYGGGTVVENDAVGSKRGGEGGAVAEKGAIGSKKR